MDSRWFHCVEDNDDSHGDAHVSFENALDMIPGSLHEGECVDDYGSFENALDVVPGSLQDGEWKM